MRKKYDFCECGKKKQAQYDRCFKCNQASRAEQDGYDKCDCGNAKKVEYAVCYTCNRSGRSPKGNFNTDLACDCCEKVKPSVKSTADGFGKYCDNCLKACRNAPGAICLIN